MGIWKILQNSEAIPPIMCPLLWLIACCYYRCILNRKLGMIWKWQNTILTAFLSGVYFARVHALACLWSSNIFHWNIDIHLLFRQIFGQQVWKGCSGSSNSCENFFLKYGERSRTPFENVEIHNIRIRKTPNSNFHELICICCIWK